MTDLARLSADLKQSLRTSLEPVGIAFLSEPPPGLARASSSPASCAFWKRAADGESFYTEAADHLNCPIGAHTHKAEMSPAKSAELMSMVGTMVQLGYLSMSEVPGIPQRKTSLQRTVYAPLARMPVQPDLVLVRGTAAQLMLVVEAAQAAGLAPDAPAMGRPTCAALPQAENSGKPAVSLGCIGNRVYTGLEDGEGYVAIPAQALGALMDKLSTIAHANAELEKFHRARLAAS